MDILHVFVLYAFITVQQNKLPLGDPLHFININDCTYFAVKIARQGSMISAYCVPEIRTEDMKVY